MPSCGREVAYHLVAVCGGEQAPSRVSASMSSDELTAVMEVMD